jgi:hypothetical protein
MVAVDPITSTKAGSIQIQTRMIEVFSKNFARDS